MSNFLLPGAVVLIFLYGALKKTDLFSAFVQGAAENLRLVTTVLPSLLCLLLAVNLFRASGAMDVLCACLKPLTGAFLPKEVLPLCLLRPLNGAGALAAFSDILKTCGPDSFAGRVAAVMMGSTETTFYTVALYSSAVSARRTRHAVPCALAADLTGFLLSAAAVFLLMQK